MNTSKVIIFGKVQGVGFRYSVKEIATGFDVVGHVKNLPNGAVEIVAQGEQQEVSEFITEIIDESDLTALIADHHTATLDNSETFKGFKIAE